MPSGIFLKVNHPGGTEVIGGKEGSAGMSLDMWEVAQLCTCKGDILASANDPVLIQLWAFICEGGSSKGTNALSQGIEKNPSWTVNKINTAVKQ